MVSVDLSAGSCDGKGMLSEEELNAHLLGEVPVSPHQLQSNALGRLDPLTLQNLVVEFLEEDGPYRGHVQDVFEKGRARAS